MNPPQWTPRKKPSKTELVTVAEFGHSIEAQLARTKLQSQKIKAYVLDENFISLMPVYDIALGGVKLKVKDSDLERAAKILGQKRRGNFWAPNLKFFITYLFSGYVLWIPLILLGLLIYLLKGFVIGPIDKYLVLVFNEGLFGILTLSYSARLSKVHSAWMNKWSGTKDSQTNIRRGANCLGLFIFALGVGLVLQRKYFFYSASLLFWGFLSLAAWKLFFNFISSSGFARKIEKFLVFKKKK